MWSDKNGVINKQKAKDIIIKIFGTWERFVIEIKVNFGIMNECKKAKWAIKALR